MSEEHDWRHAIWQAIGRSLSAHAVMLRDTAILDDDSAAALLTTIDGVQHGEPPPLDSSFALVAVFDERFDSLTAPGTVGAGAIARTRYDVAATAQRLVLREHALALAEQQLAVRDALIVLAEDHVFTLLSVWSGSAALQPTNLAHLLSATIAPLRRAARYIHLAHEHIDRSPLGAAALGGPAMPVDRDETADLLGYGKPAESTFDALAAVDHFVAAAHAASLAVAPIRRLISELLLWLRTDPQALRLAEDLLAPHDPALPHLRPPLALDRLGAEALAVAFQQQMVSTLAIEASYVPQAELLDRLALASASALSSAIEVSRTSAALLSGPIEFNRAWLARNAGRGLVTAGDLSDFLMAEEELDPASARNITALVTGRAQQEGIEASGITPAMIDAAAMLVIGRELGIEIERLGAYLAPRRFVEKRTLLGGPAAPAIRDYLAIERGHLEADRRWLDERGRRIALASENLEVRTQEILASAAAG